MRWKVCCCCSIVVFGVLLMQFVPVNSMEDDSIQFVEKSDGDQEVHIEVLDGESTSSERETRTRDSIISTEKSEINSDASSSDSGLITGSGSGNDITAVANVYGEDGNLTNGELSRNENSTANATAKPVVNTTVSCIERELPIVNGTILEPIVEIVNTTILHSDVLWINATIRTRSTPSNCSIVLFYAHWCPFSAKAAPHYNALARAFPNIRVAAIDATVHSSVNSFFGILSVPTILLFHNGKTVAKFNDTSLTINKFAEFIHVFTDLKSDENLTVTSQDFSGPLPSVPSETKDVWLYLAWIFIVICFIHYASKSTLWRKVSDLVRTTWREAEAQHEHTD